MSLIKKFFQKKKMDIKFKKAGDGQKLSDDSAPKSSVSSGSVAGGSRRMDQPMTSERMMAATAALERTQAPKAAAGGGSFTGQHAIQVRVRRELEQEKKAQAAAAQAVATSAGPTEVNLLAAPMLAVSGVFFKCAVIEGEVLPKKEMESRIQEFLLSQLADEPEMTSALMIQTLNKDPERIRVCVETLSKYLDNIISHPGEEKYCKIRVQNKAFQERVCKLEGTQEFLQAAGFAVQMMPHADGVEEAFYVMNEEMALATERLMNVKEYLLIAEPIRPELDRGLRVFYPSPQATRMAVPQDFYNVTPEELKREQQARAEAVEKLGVLRTKAMRERDELRELRKYRYTLIRVRFPNGVILQGTFRATEKAVTLMDFIRENLQNDWIPFTVCTSTGQKITEEEKSFAEAGLVPAVLINFAFDPTVMSEVAAQQGALEQDMFLKPEILSLIQSL